MAMATSRTGNPVPPEKGSLPEKLRGAYLSLLGMQKSKAVLNETAPEKPRGAYRAFLNVHKSKAVLVAVLLALVVVTSIISPVFLTPNNLLNILIQVSIVGILACAGTMVMVSGGIDLSVGSSMSVTGTAMAVLMVAGVNIYLVMLIGIGIATFVGLINGVLAAFAKTHPFILTLGMLTLLQGAALLISSLPVVGLPREFTSMLSLRPLGIPLLVLGFVFVAITVGFILTWTPLGRRLFAIGGSETAASLAGIRVRRTKIGVYALNGMFVGVAAILLLMLFVSSQPRMGAGLELVAIAAIAVGGTPLAGGRGDVVGTVLGVVLLGMIGNALTLMRVDTNIQYVIQGIVIIVAVMAQRDWSRSR
jgi:ribose/xylose/arabinose/galactoside ABC-type transport system permease subunit